MADQLVGILGGTFDPPHIGHLRTALDVKQALGLDQLRLIPNAVPPHRQAPLLSADKRLELLQQAIADIPGLVADDCEIQRQGPSYMVDTLETLSQQIPESHLCLIIGTDAYRDFCSWKQWQRILQLSHLVVMVRAGHGEPVNPALDQRCVDQLAQLRNSPAGCVYIQQVSQLEISSTRIRQMVQAGENIQFLVPESIRSQIETFYKG